MYVCLVDSSHSKFRATAVEHHEWIVDERGDFIGDVDCYDADLVEVLSCADCGSKVTDIDWKRKNDGS